jgi:Spy/CpxP family protein refolding chaperone
MMRSLTLRWFVGCLAVAVFLGWQAPAQAQVVRMQTPRFMLLTDEAVQKELKLTPEQIKKVKEETQDLFQPGPDGQQRLMIGPDTDLEEVDQRIEKLLKPEQVTRWNELHLQRIGFRSLTLPRVAKELKITNEQQTKIENLLEDFQQKLMERVQAQQAEGGVVRGTPEMVADLEKEMGTSMAKVLTEEQKKKWEVMKGAKFTFTKRGEQKKG